MTKRPENIHTPAYVIDETAIRHNLDIASRIKAQAGCDIVLALKGFAFPALFPVMAEFLDGTTASGLYEARLGHERFGGQVHAYAPAFSDEEMETLPGLCTHIYFNSIAQFERHSPHIRAAYPSVKVGLRVNSRFSQVRLSALYNPSAPSSRFGVQPEELDHSLVERLDSLHFHNLCENMAEDSAALIDHISENFGAYLHQVEHVNLGGGHYFTHPDYRPEILTDAVKRLRERFDIGVTLEPGGALAYRAGRLVMRVLDIIENDGIKIALLDGSASAHLSDILEADLHLPVAGAGGPGAYAHDYILGGRTCMTGDVFGTYSFPDALRVGDILEIEDAAQYSFVKSTTFNGVPHPDLTLLHADGRYEVIRRFGYEDFLNRLSSPI